MAKSKSKPKSKSKSKSKAKAAPVETAPVIESPAAEAVTKEPRSLPVRVL